MHLTFHPSSLLLYVECVRFAAWDKREIPPGAGVSAAVGVPPHGDRSEGSPVGWSSFAFFAVFSGHGSGMKIADRAESFTIDEPLVPSFSQTRLTVKGRPPLTAQSCVPANCPMLPESPALSQT